MPKKISKKEKRKIFSKIIQDIDSVKIQGARNVAKEALKAYFLFPGKASKKKLLSIRPTEPLLRNILDKAEKGRSYSEIMKYFRESQEKINNHAFKIIKNNDVIFTHCHSSTVSGALAHAKKRGKKFEIYVTETRPLYQGRKTVKDMKKAKIKVTQFVDSAAQVALTKRQGTKKVSKFFIGADALTKNGIINKIGSGLFAHIAHENKIPIYVFAGSLKYTSHPVKMEQRSLGEVWKGLKTTETVNVKNPAFEFVPRKYIKEIISELGKMSYGEFLRKVKH